MSLLSKFSAICDGLCNDNPTGLHKVGTDSSQLTKILQIAFGVIGVVALVIIILAGLQLITSAGDKPDATKKARDTIIFAAIGLAVAIGAELLVSTVLNKL